jgi:hypothetical protein
MKPTNKTTVATVATSRAYDDILKPLFICLKVLYRLIGAFLASHH